MERSGGTAVSLHADVTATFTTGGVLLTDGDYRPGLSISRHDHELASISVVLAGSYEERFGERRRHVRAGSVIIHPAGEHHDERHDAVRTTLLNIELPDQLLNDLGRVGQAFTEAWDTTCYGVVALAYRLRREIALEAKTSALAVETGVMEIIALLTSRQSGFDDRLPWLATVRDRLEDDDALPTLAELSTLANVHPVYLARAFRRRFGCSIGDYVRRRQVGRAVLMLENIAIPLATIAGDAGFADQSHMTRAIRDRTGLTPGAWRRHAERRALR